MHLKNMGNNGIWIVLIEKNTERYSLSGNEHNTSNYKSNSNRIHKDRRTF